MADVRGQKIGRKQAMVDVRGYKIDRKQAMVDVRGQIRLEKTLFAVWPTTIYMYTDYNNLFFYTI